LVRIGLISDVHANLYALRAAVARLRAEGVDAWVCAGDLVGYGPHPNECVGAGSLYPTALPPGPADVALTGEGRYLVNPGAVGQSRQRETTPRARFALVDLAAGHVRFYAEPYDVAATRAALRAQRLPREADHVRPGRMAAATRRTRRLLRLASGGLRR
jgi:diadenosine tetraphosphatase ApaH/serine/threonine PP2A family protein phosphatase